MLRELVHSAIPETFGVDVSTRALVTVVSLITAAVIAVCITALVIVLRPPSDESSDDRANLVVERTDQDGNGQEPQQDRTEAAVRKAAQDAFDSYAAGNYGAFWDSWTSEAQALISRDDYLRLFELCKPQAEGLRFEIKQVTVDDDVANVEVARLIAAFTYQFRYENGRWRYVPDAQAQADYRKPIEQLASEKRAAGACAS